MPHIGKHSFNLPTQKNGAPPDLTGNYKQKNVLKNNCSSSTTKRAQQTSSNMNSNCCFNVPARVVLYFLSWSGFLVSFMMRNDVSSFLSLVSTFLCYLPLKSRAFPNFYRNFHHYTEIFVFHNVIDVIIIRWLLDDSIFI